MGHECNGYALFCVLALSASQLQNDPKILDQDNQQSYTKILSTRKMRSQLQGPSALNQVLGQHCYFTHVDEPIRMPL